LTPSLQLAGKVEHHFYASIYNVVAVTLSASCVVHGFGLSDSLAKLVQKSRIAARQSERRAKWLTRSRRRFHIPGKAAAIF
jgi:hypothetical protein